MGHNDPVARQRSASRGASALEPATRIRYRVLAAGWSLALVAYIHRQSFVRAAPEIQEALHLSTGEIGYLAAAFLMAYGVFQMPCGVIGDRLGARHLLTIVVLGWSLTTGLTALVAKVPSSGMWPFVALVCLRFLFGAFQAGCFPVWSRVMADWMPIAARGTAQGTVWMFSRAGGAIGPFLFLWLFAYFKTWTIPLWLLGGLGIVWCIVFWPWFRNRPDETPHVNAAEHELIAFGRVAPVGEMDVVGWSAMVRSVNVWALCLMYGFVGFAGNFITNLLPVYLKDDRHLSPEAITWLTGLPLAVGIGSCALGGVLSDVITRSWGNRKWGRRFNGCVGLSLAGTAILVVPHVEPVWLLALLLSASFFFNDLNIGPAWAACVDVGERHAGAISGAMNMTGQFFGAAGMAFAGRMLQQGHPELLFLIFSISYGLAALCWLAVDVTKPLRASHRGTGQQPA